MTFIVTALRCPAPALGASPGGANAGISHGQGPIIGRVYMLSSWRSCSVIHDILKKSLNFVNSDTWFKLDTRASVAPISHRWTSIRIRKFAANVRKCGMPYMVLCWHVNPSPRRDLGAGGEADTDGILPLQVFGVESKFRAVVLFAVVTLNHHIMVAF